MMRYLPNFVLFCAFLIFGQMLIAGQISVINPFAGSEITGVVNVSPTLVRKVILGCHLPIIWACWKKLYEWHPSIGYL